MTDSKSSQGSALRAAGLGASITVKDIAASLQWFEQALGFTLDHRYEREGKLVGASVRAGEVRLVINQDDGKKGWDRIKGQGLLLQINMAGGVDAVAERLKANGTTLLNEPADMPWGQRMFQFHDPDGFKWSVSMPVAK